MNHCSGPQRRHFAQLSIDRGAYLPAIYFFLQSLNSYAGRRLFAAQFIEFAGKLLDVGFSLIGPRALLSFQTHHRIMQAVGCRSALLGVGDTPIQLQLGNYAGVVHLAHSVRFPLRIRGGCFGLAVVRTRFLQSIFCCLLILLQSLLFRGNLSFAGTDLRIGASQLGLLFAELKMLSPRVQFDQNVSSFYFLVELQMSCHNSSADCGLHRMRRPVYFQLGFIGDRIDRHPRQEEPNHPRCKQ